MTHAQVAFGIEGILLYFSYKNYHLSKWIWRLFAFQLMSTAFIILSMVLTP